MKILSKKYLRQKKQKKNTETERLILSSLINPFIIQLQFAFQTPKKLYLVTEFAQGGLQAENSFIKQFILTDKGELFFHLRRFIRFIEEQVRFFAGQNNACA